MHDYLSLSRALYRRLVSVLEQDCSQPDPKRARQTLLDACEATMLRLATDHDYFARPDRFLFSSIRALYPMRAQLRVRRIIDRDLAVAAAILEQQAAAQVRSCPATTRCGTACKREPVGGHRYCPSHRHLESELEVVPAQVGARGRALVV